MTLPNLAYCFDKRRPEDLVRKAPLIFEGEVVKIEYRNSESSQQHPKGLPHTFVTYKVNQVIFGKIDSFFTLRILGGAHPDGIFLDISHYPNFDVGERDLLLVEGNTVKGCPFIGCTEGRFRISQGKVFSDEGRVIRRGQGANKFISFGSFQPITEVISRTIQQPNTGKKVVLVTKGDEIKPEPIEADQLKLEEFVEMIRKLKGNQVPSNPIPSADIRNSIPKIELLAVAPPIPPPAKLIPPKDAEEIREQKLLEANGGNPVIKE